MKRIPVPFFVIALSPDMAANGFSITESTVFAEFVAATTKIRALAIFESLDAANNFIPGKALTNGVAIPIRTTTKAIDFLCEVRDRLGITHVLMDDGSHSTTRSALLIDAVVDELRSQFEGN